MIRPLTSADTADALELLRARPLQNLFLEYVVASGVLGRVPGFLGWSPARRLEAIAMVGPLGGTALEVRDANAFAPLAEAIARTPLRPRHLVGSEDVTVPFFREYERFAAKLRWSRREAVLALGSRDLRALAPAGVRVRVEPARESDLAELTANSAEQHREDLREDREAADESAFRQRHAQDLRDGRWWVVRERGRIVFQVHVGAATPRAVQLGGVFVPADSRGRGIAKTGVRAICAKLLDRHELVTLYCDENNTVALRVYEQVGFRFEFFNRSYLLEQPSARSEQLGYG